MQLALLLGSLGPRGARALCICERTCEAAGTPAAFFEEAEPSVSFFGNRDSEYFPTVELARSCTSPKLVPV